MNTPQSAGVLHRESTLYTEDGFRLFVQRWEPGDELRRAELLVVHGYADHSGRYRELAHVLAQGGIGVTAIDLRGHGHSEGRRGFIQRFSDYAFDVRSAFATLPTNVPRFVLGHSLGGLIVLDVVARDPLRDKTDGVIVMSPFLGLTRPLAPLKSLAGELAALLWPPLALPNGLAPEDMSRDPEMVDAYRRDRLVFRFATAGWFKEVREAQTRVLGDTELSLPMLLYFSPDDPVASGALTHRFAKHLVCPDKQVRERPGAKHELLNETDRATTHEEIRAWILSHHGTRG